MVMRSLLMALTLVAGQTNDFPTLDLWKRTASEDSAFHVRVRRGDRPTVVRLQLTNRTRLEKFICVEEVTWEFERTDGALESGGWIGNSPHGGPCDGRHNWHQLSPGKTYLLSGPLERDWSVRVTMDVWHGSAAGIERAKLGWYGWAGRAKEIS